MGKVIALHDLPEHARLLLAIRKQRHWTQAQLAVELGRSVRTVRRWEGGGSEPSVGDVLVFRALLSDGLQQTGWAHLAAVEAIQRDARSGVLSRDQAEALRGSLNACLRAIVESMVMGALVA